MINKKTLKSKKGFTIVELVIVIAVIAILAAVLIPTFVNVTEKAKISAAQSNARNAYTTFISETVTIKSNDNVQIVSGNYTFEVSGGSLKSEPVTRDASNYSVGYKVSGYDGVVIYLKSADDFTFTGTDSLANYTTIVSKYDAS